MIGKRTRLALDKIHLDENGDYVYGGMDYCWNGSLRERRRVLNSLWLLTAGCEALCLLGGCIPTFGVSHVFYVILPYAVSFGLSLWSLWILGNITVAKGKLREYRYEATVERLPKVLTTAGVFGGVTAAAELLQHLISGAREGRLYVLLFALVMCCFGALSIFGAKAAKGRLTWTPVAPSEKPRTNGEL